jgi:hypothetical protein
VSSLQTHPRYFCENPLPPPYPQPNTPTAPPNPDFSSLPRRPLSPPALLLDVPAATLFLLALLLRRRSRSLPSRVVSTLHSHARCRSGQGGHAGESSRLHAEMRIWLAEVTPERRVGVARASAPGAAVAPAAHAHLHGDLEARMRPRLPLQDPQRHRRCKCPGAKGRVGAGVALPAAAIAEISPPSLCALPF